MERLRAKSVMLTGYLEFLLNQILLDQKFSSAFRLLRRKTGSAWSAAFYPNPNKRAGIV